jgi:hypothetical protein
MLQVHCDAKQVKSYRHFFFYVHIFFIPNIFLKYFSSFVNAS